MHDAMLNNHQATFARATSGQGFVQRAAWDEALFVGATTDGERVAAGEAAKRIKASAYFCFGS
jgi:hypothetical protein